MIIIEGRMNINEHWAMEGHQPRDSQITAFDFMVSNSDKKYLFLELPIGTGKSALGVTYANWIKTLNASQLASYILTPQKILQEQYEKSFKSNNFTSLYGRNYYRCNTVNGNCEMGNIVKASCPGCPSKAAHTRAINADHTVLNYTLGLILFGGNSKYERRSLMVFDECHQLEKILTDFNNMMITKYNCTKYKIPWITSRTIEDIQKWVKELYWPSMDEQYTALSDECELIDNTKKLSSEDINKLTTLSTLSEHLNTVNSFMMRTTDELYDNFIVTGDDDSIKLKYIFGRENFHDVLEPKADKFLFMSSTIFDYTELCKNLNIPLEETAFISLESEFNKDNRPVIYKPTMKMSYGWDHANKINERKVLIKNIKFLLKQHADESGIIHTGNFQIAKWLVSELSNGTHEIFHHNPGSGDNRNKIISAYINSRKPSLLISPSITEGLDLVDDRARFVIFAKIAFGSLGDAWIKKRMDMSNNWYLINALTDVIQGCGRVVRSHDDFGVCYILDSSWEYLFNKTKHHIPRWWLEAYHKM